MGRTSLYHPQTNLLEAFQVGCHRIWREIFNSLTSCFNYVISEVTKCTPAESFFGCKQFHSLINAWSINAILWEVVDTKKHRGSMGRDFPDSQGTIGRLSH
ncbi:hypothetical protein PR048_033032 [Dryococelus australis]|uniref:Uncharacterized protein n=1 Tax=Dryococelus australis TaxID=614101 RepID=A0ABQ9G4P0_9NEOP|nr:hypothetical protein PR048_033032 [Dryococelus australis]